MLIFNIPQNLSPLPSGPQLPPPGDAALLARHHTSYCVLEKSTHQRGVLSDQTAEGEREAMLVIYAKKAEQAEPGSLLLLPWLTGLRQTLPARSL